MSSPRESSVIIPTRGEGDRLEVFWSRRQPHLRFLGGFHAFFGGSVEHDDVSIPAVGDAEVPHRFLGCAARELFEEGGVLVTDQGIFHAELHPGPFSELSRVRAAVLAEELDFARWLSDAGLRIDASRFHHLGRWITPEFSEIRFDSHFFAVDFAGDELEDLHAAAWGEHLFEIELHRGEWVAPSIALERWRRAELFISPPIRFALDALRDANRGSTARADEADQGDLVSFAEATGGVYLVPLRTPTLPPATHTNCYLVGDERMVMIDPGSPHPEENAILFEIVDALLAEGRSLEAIVLTHHHVDHVSGVAQVLERWKVPVWGHRRTAEQLHEPWEVGRLLEHHDTIDLGDNSLHVLHTPGHASGHLSFVHERTNTALVGDMIASYGTILVNPPDGHMGDYLDSLDTLRRVEPRALFPAHGWVVSEADARLEFYTNHRLQREEKVLGALRRFGGLATPADVVPEAYDDAPKRVWPIAARSAEAHLIHLVELGAARRVGARFVAES